MNGIWISREEYEAVRTAEGDAVKLWLAIRFRMDRGSWMTGTKSKICWNSLAENCETEIRRGRGVQVIKRDESLMRRRADELERRGVITSKGGDVIVFECSMAKSAHARFEQTRQANDTVYPQRGWYSKFSDKSLNKEDILISCGAVEAYGFEDQKQENPTHIKGQGFYPPQSSSKAEPECGAGDARRGARGVNRDRPAGSQAGPLGQAGKPYAGDRDRAAPSHDGRGASVLEGGRARPVGEEAVGVVAGRAMPSAGRLSGGSGEGLAAGDALAGERCHAGALADALKAVAVGANVRVPVGSGVFSAWAADGVTVEVMRMAVDRAFSARKKAGSVQPVPLGYLASCVTSVREELRSARDVVARGPGKRMSAKGAQDRVLLLARSMGLDARPGEDWPALQARVNAAVERAGRGAA